MILWLSFKRQAMKSQLLILGCLAVVSAGIWYLLKKDKDIQEWIDEAPVGPIKDHLTIQEHAEEPADIRELLHKAKEQI
jgi:hypothetical protein